MAQVLHPPAGTISTGQATIRQHRTSNYPAANGRVKEGTAMYDAMMAETISITGHGGDQIEGYLARPLGPGPFGSVVVIHHMPGYDAETKEITRTFAAHGYLALCPNLYYPRGAGREPGRRGGGRPRPGRRTRRAAGRRRRGSGRLPAGDAGVQREGGRDRLLLGRPPVVPRRGQPAAGRRRRLLRRVRRRHPARGHAAQGRPDRAPGQGPVLPAARPVRRRRPAPLPGPGGRAGQGAHQRRQGARVPQLRRRRARLLRGEPARLPARGRHGRLARRSGTSTAATWRAERSRRCAPT